MSRRLYLIFSTTCILISAFIVNCGPQPKSQLQEEWDPANQPELFGVGALAIQEAKLPLHLRGRTATIPWTDSYWPLYDMGMAARWIDPSELAPFESKVDVHLPSAQYRRQAAQEVFNALKDSTLLNTLGWQQSIYASPAEKLDLALADPSMTATRNEIDSYLLNKREFKDLEWEWMGHCHGWAAASVLFDTPRYGVLMPTESKNQVMFTPGDVRALLTKAASDNAFDQPSRNLGHRCDVKDQEIPRDHLNRIVDGSLGQWDSKSDLLSGHRPIRVIKNNWHEFIDLKTDEFDIVFKFGPRYQNSSIYWLRALEWEDDQEQVAAVRLYTVKVVDGELKPDLVIADKNARFIGRRMTDDGGWLRGQNGKILRDRDLADQIWSKVRFAANLSPDAAATSFSHFRYYKDCRDLNAGAFHTVLSKYLSQGHSRKEGRQPRAFIMDHTHDEEVWNHPIFAFESQIGEATPLTMMHQGKTLRDPFRTWRHPKTHRIYDVRTLVTYAVENGPMVQYRPEDEAFEEVWYRYSLEVDVHGNIIGGEWHGLDHDESEAESRTPLAGVDLLLDLKRQIKAEDDFSIPVGPDFIWDYPEGSWIQDGATISAKWLRNLHQCSLGLGAQSSPRIYDVADTEFEYVECGNPGF